MKLYVQLIVLFISLSFSIDKLPNDALYDVNGKKIKLYDVLDNGPMAINFWFLACAPCVKEMKFLDKWNKAYKDQGFKVLSINTDARADKNKVKSRIKSKKYDFQVLLDPTEDLYDKLGKQICPFTVLVDSKGNVVYKKSGFVLGKDEITLEKEIKNLIESNATKNDTVKIDSSSTPPDSIKLEKKPLKINEEENSKEIEN